MIRIPPCCTAPVETEDDSAHASLAEPKRPDGIRKGSAAACVNYRAPTVCGRVGLEEAECNRR